MRHAAAFLTLLLLLPATGELPRKALRQPPFPPPDVTRAGPWIQLTWYLDGLPQELIESHPGYIPVTPPQPVVMLYLTASADLVGQKVDFLPTNGTILGGNSAILQPSHDNPPAFAWYQTIFQPEARTGFVTARYGNLFSSQQIPVVGPPRFSSFTGPLTPSQKFQANATTDGKMNGCLATLSQGSNVTITSPNLAGVLLDDGGSKGWVKFIPPEGVSAADWVVFNIATGAVLANGAAVTLRCQDIYQQTGELTIPVAASSP